MSTDEKAGGVEGGSARQPVVVAAVDGSEASCAALRWAAEYTELVGGRLRAVMAWQWPVTAVTPAYLPVWYDAAGLARTRLHTIVREQLGAAAAADVEEDAICGEPTRVLLDAAHDASMLVVGSSAHGAFAGLLLGSTSERCVHRAPCPITVVRPAGAQAPALSGAQPQASLAHTS